MIQLLKLKSFLMTAYLWCKKNIAVVLLSLAVAAMLAYNIITKRNDQKAIDNLLRQLDSARKDFEKARQAHRDEIRQRELIEERYKKTISDLTDKYNVDVSKLNNVEKDKIREIVANNQDPRDMEQLISNVLGIRRQ